MVHLLRDSLLAMYRFGGRGLILSVEFFLRCLNSCDLQNIEIWILFFVGGSMFWNDFGGGGG